MGSHFRLGHVAIAGASVAVLVALVATPQVLGDRLLAGIDGIGAAEPAGLWLAAVSFASALACASIAWRAAIRACGGSCTPGDAAARYCVGSLVNAFAPARLGGVVRVVLFARVAEAEGRIWTAGGIAGAVGAARALWLSVLVALGSASGVLPAWPAALLALVVAGAVALAVGARRIRRRERVAHVLDAFRAIGRSPRSGAVLAGWVGLAMVARIAAATALLAAFGIERPLAAALLVVPAVELAATLPITPGNVGLSSAAVAFALSAHGVGADVALSAGIAFSGVETLTSIVAGSAGALALVGTPGVRRRLAVATAAAGCVALAGAFGATVVLPVV